MAKNTYIKFVPDESAMLELGEHLARATQCDRERNRVIFLEGQLGAGKTTLARGFLRALGHEGRVKSPTYTLVEPYEFSEGTVFHFDLYRLQQPNELESIGIQDYFVPKTICLVEWPLHGKGFLPASDLSCYIRMQGNSREVTLTAQSAVGETILQRLQHDK